MTTCFFVISPKIIIFASRMDYSINVRGRLVDLSQPQVMGILNATPDSFFAGSRKQTEEEIAQRALQIVAEGGSIIDVGAFSTRPGASLVSEEEETDRLQRALAVVRNVLYLVVAEERTLIVPAWLADAWKSGGQTSSTT